MEELLINLSIFYVPFKAWLKKKNFCHSKRKFCQRLKPSREEKQKQENRKRFLQS